MGKHSNTTSLTGKYRKKPITSASSSSARMKTLNRNNKNDNQHRQDNNNKRTSSSSSRTSTSSSSNSSSSSSRHIKSGGITSKKNDKNTMKSTRNASIDSFFTKKSINNNSDDEDDLDIINKNKHDNNNNSSNVISMTQEEGFRVMWKTSPGRRNSNGILRESNSIFGNNRNGNGLLGNSGTTVDVQNEVNMIDDVLKSLRSNDHSHSVERNKKRRRHDVELSTSPRPDGASLINNMPGNILIRQGRNNNGGDHFDNNSKDNKFLKPRSRLEENMKAIQRVNQAKRIKRKRKETFGKYKSNNKGIGVRTSISRLSSRVDLDDLFSDSDDEEDSMTTSNDGGEDGQQQQQQQKQQEQQQQQQDDDIVEIKNEEDTILVNSQPSNDDIDEKNKKDKDNVNKIEFLELNSTVPSPVRPIVRNVKNNDGKKKPILSLSQNAATKIQKHDKTRIVRKKMEMIDAMKTTTTATITTGTIANASAATAINNNNNNNTNNSIIDDDDEWALRALELTMLKQQKKKASAIPQQVSILKQQKNNKFQKTSTILAPTQTHVSVAQDSTFRPLPLYSMSNAKQLYTRFKVTSRVTNTGTEKKFVVKPDKSFLPSNTIVTEDPFAMPLIVRLRGIWMSTEVEERDSINIVWDPWIMQNSKNSNGGNNNSVVKNLKEAMERNEIVVDNNSHWIILRPDVLISPSVVGTASKCLRQAIISSKIRDSASAKICTLGNLKHDLFEHALLDGNLSTDYLRNASSDIIYKRAQECYASGLRDDEALAEMNKFIPKLKQWASIIMRQSNLNNHHPAMNGSSNRAGNGIEIMDTTGSTLRFAIDNILATEEDILSPMWGLRARPDASAVVKIEYQHHNMNQNLQRDMQQDKKSGRYVSPLELKTGNPHQSHQAQALLYARAFMDRYGGDTNVIGPPPVGTEVLKPSLSATNAHSNTTTLNGAILIYLGLRDGSQDKEKVLYVREKRLELQALFGLRNNLARTMAENIRGEVKLASPLSSNSQSDGEKRHTAPACRPLPGVIGRKGTCDMCYVRDVCSLYHKGWENGTEETAKMGPAFNEAIGHLSESHLEYYRKWDRLLDLEDSQLHRSSKMLWRVPASERQARGTCAANLLLTKKERQTNLNKNITFEYTFSRKKEDLTPTQNSTSSNSAFGYSPSRQNDFSEYYNKRLENTFSQGDKVVISVDSSHVALGRAVVVSVTRDRIMISSKIPLAIPSSLKRVLNTQNNIRNNNIGDDNGEQILWCLDRDVYESGMKSARQNIRRMLIGPSPISKYQKKKLEKEPKQLALREEITNRTRRLRELIVDGKRPEFMHNWKQTFQLQNMSNWAVPGQSVAGCETRGLVDNFNIMNDDQSEALRMCLSASDYAMVLGMPGTGKTTLIALLVRSLINQGKRVLLSSFTNSAVDNMLLKLRDAGVDFVRIGNEKSVHPHIRPNMPQILAQTKRKTESPINAVEQIIESAKLIGTTCLSCGGGLMQQLRFDVCIVDEASQITEATCLGPLHLADKFILVGDHNQLTAVVRNKNAKKEGLATSLFKRLADLHPESVCQLTYQYRMNKEIMSLANCLVYEEKLKCGSTKVANRQLQIPASILNNPKILPWPRLHKETLNTGHWLKDILRPDKPVIFVDTDGIGVPSLEKRTDIRMLSPDSSNVSNNGSKASRVTYSKGGLVNRVEASLVDTCIAGLIRCRVPIEDIGVICPYRSQLKVLKSPAVLGKYGEDLEVQTVDKYQGRDKPCIIVSLVRSNDKFIVGELLRDWRRINVAFTRAMCKLIIFGSHKTLSGSKEKHIKTFMSKVNKSGWRYSLHKQGHRFYRHYFEKNIKRRNANNNSSLQSSLSSHASSSGGVVGNSVSNKNVALLTSKENVINHHQSIKGKNDNNNNSSSSSSSGFVKRAKPTRIVPNQKTKVIRKEKQPGTVMYEIEKDGDVFNSKHF